MSKFTDGLKKVFGDKWHLIMIVFFGLIAVVLFGGFMRLMVPIIVWAVIGFAAMKVARAKGPIVAIITIIVLAAILLWAPEQFQNITLIIGVTLGGIIGWAMPGGNKGGGLKK
jgi:hypothetical protein